MESTNGYASICRPAPLRWSWSRLGWRHRRWRRWLRTGTWSRWGLGRIESETATRRAGAGATNRANELAHPNVPHLYNTVALFYRPIAYTPRVSFLNGSYYTNIYFADEYFTYYNIQSRGSKAPARISVNVTYLMRLQLYNEQGFRCILSLSLFMVEMPEHYRSSESHQII